MSQVLSPKPVLDLDLTAADAAEQSIDIEDLRDLMSSVTETTERLQRTHTALKDQVARLQRELTEANAQLRRSRSLAALGEMAAGIAHEVRNPLGSIQLYVQVLAEELADRPNQSELCRKIDHAVTGLDAIVRDVLSFARNMTIHPAPIVASDLVDRAIANCQSLVRGGRITVRREIDAGMALHADPCLMTQALGNVIRNAIEAVHQHADELGSRGESARREVVLSGRSRTMRCPDGRQARRAVLAVEDTGPGIPPGVLERMFNPFFTTRKTGTGLGLAIVHRIVDAHGGHVSVRNVERNGRRAGARLELCLPEDAAATAPDQDHEENPS